MTIYKQLTLSDDGYLMVELNAITDFDPFILQRINEQEHCLTCINDSYNQLLFYYDLSGYELLSDYLKYHEFGKEVIDFVIELLQSYVSKRSSLPIIADLDYIYVRKDSSQFYFIALPLDYEVSKQMHMHSDFIMKLLKQIKVDDYYSYGVLTYLYQDEINVTNYLNKLISMEKFNWWKYLTTKTKPYLNDIRGGKQYVRQAKRMIDVEHQDTCLLINEGYYLVSMDRINRYAINKNLTIGRALDNDIIIENNHVSNHHASLSEDLVLVDLHSSNGTKVNGEKITTMKLEVNDVISFANVQYIIEKEGLM